MTGYGRGEAADSTMSVTVEVKSVNHRFFECSVKCPRQFSFLEDKLKSYFQSRVSRGKIDVFVTYDKSTSATEKLTVNETFAESSVAVFKELAEKLGVPNDITVSTLMRVDGVFSVTHEELDEKSVENLVITAASIAADTFISARETEGEKLASDVLSRADTILNYVTVVEQRSPETVKEYRERLEGKIKELLGNATVDEQRLLTETAIFADRVAVNEETVRLRSHISHLKELFNAGGVIGKKLDFIVQEMNRETNTIGSKCQDINISHTVVDMKSEIEKIREQIQNIE
jgi:uncharacterized protein (TIGR00255 family)